MGIKNGKDTNLTQSSGTMPDVSGAMLNWFQTMTFSVVSKALVNFEVVETQSTVTAQAVIQPFTAQQLQIRPEGERGWRWHTLHSDTSLALNTDDVVTYQGRIYRVMDKSDYSLYGYLEYHIVEDYQ